MVSSRRKLMETREQGNKEGKCVGKRIEENVPEHE